ncbi:MAG: hypothetical protein COB76_04070 [Alphaproteobacteria bacterium]|nr:MAG: hypothetical protein COB76_04070 [Alphaproteobacteria bacterium]
MTTQAQPSKLKNVAKKAFTKVIIPGAVGLATAYAGLTFLLENDAFLQDLSTVAYENGLQTGFIRSFYH